MSMLEIGREGWIPFDDPRNGDQFKRADIVFGPDMFDPQVTDESRPFMEAVEDGRLGLSVEDLSRPTGEIFKTDDPSELRQLVRQCIQPALEKPVLERPKKGFLKSLLTFN
jgi:hypothetical protein